MSLDHTNASKQYLFARSNQNNKHNAQSNLTTIHVPVA